MPITDQIERAKTSIFKFDNHLKELLIKPETPDQQTLKIKSITDNISDLSSFDIIGVTEKEIGTSILSRMTNIAKIRTSLSAIGKETPIHVFGSLDTITTPLYFVSGADIFDGLTWLRYAFCDGYTMYKHNYSAVNIGVNVKSHNIDANCWYHNYYYLSDLKLQMRRYLKDGDFGHFSYHTDLIRNSYANVIEAIGD
ncbi:conserved hypothetical protein [Solidesulfovibrio fructosivorans JJ]]|uniref:Uncharacterized protein n=1 Tax=Solidesulfovibrio fructosivorans JJ] TaxID=596151 RepID=E1JT93_SOLFR|nr:hypothetical protein [Solidesulfovibrio fructosivorans]EFL52353.1 conserved hypothetical protein [Solidesulfovibrio fructosivorans JJ]]